MIQCQNSVRAIIYNHFLTLAPFLSLLLLSKPRCEVVSYPVTPFRLAVCQGQLSTEAPACADCRALRASGECAHMCVCVCAVR